VIVFISEVHWFLFCRLLAGSSKAYIPEI